MSNFEGLKECHNAKAAGVIQAITQVLNEINDNWKQKLVSMRSVKVSGMTGKNNSVYVHLKPDVPSVRSIHCIAQKLELDFKTIKDAQRFFQDAKELLLGIWIYYKHSCKASHEIKEQPDMIGERA